MESCARIHRPRRPQQTPLYRLLESLFEPVKLVWEERFEARYGFWQGCWDQAVARYLDCGVWECGFARVRCGECRYETLVAFSCKQRELCPSCAVLLREPAPEEVRRLLDAPEGGAPGGGSTG